MNERFCGRRVCETDTRRRVRAKPGGLGRRPDARRPCRIDRLHFLTPDRSQLPAAECVRHACAVDGGRKRVGYTEASRGCKHLCRHCPVVPVYNGAFRVVQQEVVLADIRQQVAAGAEHITFGDPDFFNGPGHAMAHRGRAACRVSAR